MRFLGVIALLLTAATSARAGEVHTRATPGTWSSDPQRGTVRGAVANDAGYSFWLLGDAVSLTTPFTVIAQVRFASRVDYGGAGVAIIDPRASHKTQKHLRIELSEREDTAGVGGWLGNENHFSGASKRASKDIKVNEWYELAIKIDGRHATGYLDGVEVFDADVPELAQLPRDLTIAPFVVEADAEIRVTIRKGTSALKPLPEAKPTVETTKAKIGWIEPYAVDETDGSDVKWITTLPAPSLSDDAKGTQVHAEWTASYELRGDRVCVRVASLRAPVPSTHKLAIGYQVTLDSAIFDNGSRTKTLIVTRFSGNPSQATAGVCEAITIGGVPLEDPYKEPPAFTLPATSKKQADIEKLFAQKVAAASSPADYRAMYDALEELVLVVGPYHFLLEPISRQWHVYNRLHGAWEPTGHFAGDVTFSVVRGKVKVTPAKKRPK